MIFDDLERIASDLALPPGPTRLPSVQACMTEAISDMPCEAINRG